MWHMTRRQRDSLIVLCLCIVGVSYSQVETYVRTYGGPDWLAFDVWETAEGGYVISGRADGGYGLLRTNLHGDSLWFKSYPTGYGAYMVRQATDGGFLLAGYDGTSPNTDISIVRTDSLGMVLWSKLFGGPDDQVVYYGTMTKDGGCLTAGPVHYQSDPFASFLGLFRMDGQGDSVWFKTYKDFGSGSIQETADEGFVVACSRPEYKAALLMRCNKSGDTLWTRSFFRAGETLYGRSTALAPGGGYVLLVQGNSGNSTLNYLYRLTEHGDSLWCTSVAEGADLNTVRSMTSGHFILVGSVDSSGWSSVRLTYILDTGEHSWTRDFGGNGDYRGIVGIPSSDGGFVVVGTFAPYPYGPESFCVIKTNQYGMVTGFLDSQPSPTQVQVWQNYPNPFNPTTEIRYQVPGVSDVKLAVYDLLGREVSVLVNESKTPGTYEVTFDAAGLSSGVYVYRLQAGDFVQSRKLVLLR